MKKIFVNVLLIVVLAGSGLMNCVHADDPFIGEIKTFGYNFCPRGWAETNGQLLPIAQNAALFTLLGTTFGGNGQTTFGLPDLRGRVIVAPGQGGGLTQRTIGEKSGVEAVTLTIGEIPAHNHAISVKQGRGVQTSATGSFLGESGIYRSTGTSLALNAATVNPTGGNQPHENMQPYLVMITCIALEGIFPQRN